MTSGWFPVGSGVSHHKLRWLQVAETKKGTNFLGKVCSSILDGLYCMDDGILNMLVQELIHRLHDLRNRVWQKKTAKPAVEEPPTQDHIRELFPTSVLRTQMHTCQCKFGFAFLLLRGSNLGIHQDCHNPGSGRTRLKTTSSHGKWNLSHHCPLTMSSELLDSFDWDSQEFTYCWQTSKMWKGLDHEAKYHLDQECRASPNIRYQPHIVNLVRGTLHCSTHLYPSQANWDHNDKHMLLYLVPSLPLPKLQEANSHHGLAVFLCINLVTWRNASGWSGEALDEYQPLSKGQPSADECW